MNKNLAKYLIDLGLLISFLGVTITGIIKFKSFLLLLGIQIDYALIPMEVISQIHDWAGLAMAILVLVHLILNWDWIVAVTKDIFLKEKIN